MISAKHSKFFDGVLSKIDSNLNTEFDLFKKNYDKLYCRMFEEIEYSNKTLNCFDDMLMLKFELFMVYYGTFYSGTLFEHLLKESQLINYDNKLFTKCKSLNDHSLLLRICNNKEYINAFVKLFGHEKLLELLFEDKDALILMIIKGELTELLCTHRNIIESSRYDNGDNLMHIVLSIEDYNLEDTLINNLINYSHLINEKNNLGIFPYQFLKNKSYAQLTLMLTKKLINYSHFCRYDETTYPLILKKSGTV
jgi:hypothetical protein